MTSSRPHATDEAVQASLLSAALAASSWQVPQTVVDVLGPASGAVRLDLLLVDHELVELHRIARWRVGEPSHADLGGPDQQGVPPSPGREHLVEGPTAAARTFREQVVTVAGTTVCQPVSVRGHRLGVLVATVPGTVDPAERVVPVLAATAGLVGLLLRQAVESSDEVEVRRRSHVFSVAAEMQWDVLPPTEHRGPGVEVAALVEPAYLATSDVFDWAVDDDVLSVALLEADGEGLRAARSADLALAAVRHARRAGLDLVDQAATADDVLRRQGSGTGRVHAALVRVDLGTGRGRMVLAGAPLVLRHTAGALHVVSVPRAPALGDGEEGERSDQPLPVPPRQTLVLASSGVLQARSRDDVPFTLDQLEDVLRAPADLLDTPRQVARAVRAHCGGQVARDATCVLARWGAISRGRP
ncbi:PP2C family protein-serine/threonine phosphatase [Pseudokineococcus basanitobsidens]|uniref:PP2C family protein-serine/threonine phosphatase n=1 Tax=Pseudokineococcus basanitobsidens TaxID=1926649 RepID=A0ABU8RPN2_9ACTN